MTAHPTVSFRVEDFMLSPTAQLRPFKGMSCPVEVMSAREQRLRIRYEHDRTSKTTKIPGLIDRVQVDISMSEADLILQAWVERSAGDNKFGFDVWEYDPLNPDAERPSWVDQAYKGALLVMQDFLSERINEQNVA